MKDKIYDIICSNLIEGEIDADKATSEILDLFSVVGQSEHLPTREEMDKKWEELRGCGLDKKLTKWD